MLFLVVVVVALVALVANAATTQCSQYTTCLSCVNSSTPVCEYNTTGGYCENRPIVIIHFPVDPVLLPPGGLPPQVKRGTTTYPEIATNSSQCPPLIHFPLDRPIFTIVSDVFLVSSTAYGDATTTTAYAAATTAPYVAPTTTSFYSSTSQSAAVTTPTSSSVAVSQTDKNEATGVQLMLAAVVGALVVAAL